MFYLFTILKQYDHCAPWPARGGEAGRSSKAFPLKIALDTNHTETFKVQNFRSQVAELKMECATVKVF
jgi:hypothetical protein